MLNGEKYKKKSLKLPAVEFILLINVNCWHFNIYELDKFHAVLISTEHEKKFYNTAECARCGLSHPEVCY